MSFEHHLANAYRRRLKKQAAYQAQHRAKLARERIPERPDMADALLRALAKSMARRNGKVVDEVLKKGLLFAWLGELTPRFDGEQSIAALQRMVDRLQAVEEMRRRETDLEAAYPE